MATKLQCDICGGKLIGKAGGIFECDSCGMEYDTTWIKEKIQEIKGTVKVEGTVEVTGKVQVDTDVNKDNLLKRGFMFLEESTLKNPLWKTADDYFNKVLDIDAACGEAYLGKLMVEVKARKRSDLASAYRGDWENSSLFQKAFQYGNMTLRNELTELVRKKTYEKAESYANENNAAGSRKAAELFGQILTYRDAAKRQSDCLAKAMQGMTSLHSKRELICRVQRRIACGTNHVAGVKIDGTVVASGDNKYGQCNVEDWRNITAVAAGSYHTVALKSDGTVVSTKHLGDPTYGSITLYEGQDEVSLWNDIVMIGAGSVFTAGLKADGTVVVTGSDPKLQEVHNWQNITSIYTSRNTIFGIDSSGAILIAGGMTERDRKIVQSWMNIVLLDLSSGYPVGLKEDGTIVSTYSFISQKLSCSADIVSIACNSRRIVGLQNNGTVFAIETSSSSSEEKEYDVSGWNDIVAIGAGYEYIIGLQGNGSVIVTGPNGLIKQDVLNWRLFCNFDTIDEEIKMAREQSRNQLINELAMATRDKQTAEIELANLKGIFSGRRRKELELQIAELDQKITQFNSELISLELV